MSRRPLRSRRAAGSIAAVALALVLSSTRPATAELVPVRHTEGRTRGFLVVRDAGEKVIAVGQLHQQLIGSRVVAQLRIHFNDGSTLEETTEYSERRTFRLRSYRLVQKGPAFERQLDMSVGAAKGDVEVRPCRHPVQMVRAFLLRRE